VSLNGLPLETIKVDLIVSQAYRKAANLAC